MSGRLYHGGLAICRGCGLLEGSVSVVSPGAYVISDGRGDVDGSGGQGLFYRDVRHLPGFCLRVGGGPLIPLASRTRGSEAEFACSSARCSA
jgi:hypothetical protein